MHTGVTLFFQGMHQTCKACLFERDDLCNKPGRKILYFGSSTTDFEAFLDVVWNISGKKSSQLNNCNSSDFSIF